MSSITELDFAILEALQKIHTPVLNVIMAFFTYLGEAGAIWLVLSVVFLCIKKYRETGSAIMLSLAFEGIVSELIIKNIVRRERPFNVHPWIDTIVHKPSSYSFPSGHTCTAFCASTALFFYNKRLGAAAYTLAAVIGFSRNYFYTHYPTDVLAGAAEGVILGLIAANLNKAFYTARSARTLKAAEPPASEDQ